MSEFEDKLNAILSSPETMEQIAAIAGSLSGGDSAPAAEPASEPGQNSGGLEGLGGVGSLLGNVSPDLLTRLLPLFQEYQSGDKEKAALLAAMKPFLSQESQAKVDKAIRITRLSHVIRASMSLFKEEGHV